MKWKIKINIFKQQFIKDGILRATLNVLEIKNIEHTKIYEIIFELISILFYPSNINQNINNTINHQSELVENIVVSLNQNLKD
jgi:hypothetical protein